MKILKDLFSLENHTAIVTGANRGLGKEMAYILADAGANVVITCRNLNEIKHTADTLKQKKVEVLPVKMDVRNREEIDNMVEAAINRFGKIDVLVNNAAISKETEFENMPFADWNEILDINLNGVFKVSQAVGKIMIEQKRGSIINISSIAGAIVNNPQTHTAYNVSKAGVIMLTKCLASEWAKYNIRVNSIAPSYMAGGMAKTTIDEGGKIIDRWLSLIPMERFGNPSELGGILIYLASSASSYTTGGIHFIDGGYTIW